MNITPYNFIDVERLRYGNYPVLDTILYRWARRIEETLFDQARVEVYAGASVFEEMRFSTFFATLRQARPIYFISIAPFHGTGLFVVDNRFSAFCLRQITERSQPATHAKLSPQNQSRLQRVVQRMMEDFDQSWHDIHRIETRLQKITTYPFRARVLNPHEPCLVAQIHLSGHNISSRLTWCLPRTMLEPVLNRLKQSKVIPPLGLERRPHDHLDETRLLEHLRYALHLRVGQVDLGEAAGRLEVGNVMALHSEPGGDAVVEVGGNPVLLASVGEVQGRYAFKVNAAYTPPRKTAAVDPSAFKPLQWPAAISE